MGHMRLGDLPRTRKWQQVVGLIEGGAGTAQLANATISAAERGLIVVAALGCIIYEVVKAHGSLSTALADAKADLANAEATVESLVTAAKKAV